MTDLDSLNLDQLASRRQRVTCKYHCRACGSHFTSLRAFDAHLGGTPQSRSCSFPERDTRGKAIVLNERVGVCAIAGAEPIENVTVYEHESADRARERFAEAA